MMAINVDPKGAKYQVSYNYLSRLVSWPNLLGFFIFTNLFFNHTAALIAASYRTATSTQILEIIICSKI